MAPGIFVLALLGIMMVPLVIQVGMLGPHEQPQRTDATRVFAAKAAVVATLRADPTRAAEATRVAPTRAAVSTRAAEATAVARTAEEHSRSGAAKWKVRDYAGAVQELARLRGPVDSFFDKVLVNDPDPAVRKNRLQLLAEVRGAMNRVADFSLIAG